MSIEYHLNRPFEEIAKQIRTGLEKINIGIFAESFKFGHNEIYFEYCNLPSKPSPYKTHFQKEDKKLTILYDITSGSLLGSAYCSLKIAMPSETRIFRFDIDNADHIDPRTGKKMAELDEKEFVEHFFPNLKLKR